MTVINLFGASTAAGYAFLRYSQSSCAFSSVIPYSRRPISGVAETYFADFAEPASFVPLGNVRSPAIWISFAPIWLFAPFIESISRLCPDRLLGLRGVVACSSSSVVTKRFASNFLDRELVERLRSTESQLLATCRHLGVSCHVVRPTLIYGQAGEFRDTNLSRVVHLLRLLPVLPLPAQAGLRQPIHVSQLAAVVFHIAQRLTFSNSGPLLPELISLGGDTTLTYAEMISALQQAQSSGDPARSCCLLPIPNRLFFLLAAPLMLSSPKTFEAVLRMGANLSGFTPAHQFLGSEAQPFPVLPLA
jgi:hypothetical protein